MACAPRETSCQLHTSNARNGLKFLSYTYIPFVGLYTEDGLVLRGTEGQATRRPTPIPAAVIAVPQACCGQMGV